MTDSKYSPGLDQFIGHRLLSVAIAFITINTFFFTIRFISRHYSKTPMGIDDYLIIPAFFSCLVVCGSAIALVKYAGVGYHKAFLEMTDPGKIIVWAKFMIEVPVAYLLAAAVPKLAIIGVYLRVFVEKFYRRTAWVIFTILICSAIANILVAIFECTPVAYFYDKTIPNGHCNIDTNKYFQWASMPNVITDVAMLILPLPVIWKLQTSKNNKIGLTLTFLTGSIGLITSILRFNDFIHTDAITDGTWVSVSLMIWTIVEPSMYFIAACLPACRPLVIILRKKLPIRFSSGCISKPTRGQTEQHELSRSHNEHVSKIGNPKSKSNGFKRLGDTKRNSFENSSTDEIVSSRSWAIEGGKPMINKVLADGGEDGIHVTHDYVVSSIERS